MKKTLKFISLLVALVFIPLKVDAASASIGLTSSSTVVLGNSVTVTVTLSSSTAIGSWEMLLDYDTSYLSLVSTTSEAGGLKMVNSSSTGTKSTTYTYTFKTLKSGSTTVSMGSYLVYDFDAMSKMTVTSSSKTITVKTQAEVEASYSKDNYLKSLGVTDYELEETFDLYSNEYTVNVPENVKEVNLTGVVNDTRSSIAGLGTKEVSLGANLFEIVVTAQNGSQNTYKLTVNVIDENPIIVNVNDVEYVVVKFNDELEPPRTFTETTVTIEDVEVPAFTNEILGYTLVALKDNEGTIEYFIYDEDNSSYTLYKELSFLNLIIIPTSTNKELDDYIKGTETILGEEFTVFKLSEDSRFLIFYGKNVVTGEETFYKYDTVDQTLIVYDDEVEDDSKIMDTLLLFKNIIIGFAGIISVLFISLITLLSKNRKLRKNRGSKPFIEEVREETLKEEVKPKEKKKKKESKKEVIEEVKEETKKEELIKPVKDDVEKVDIPEVTNDDLDKTLTGQTKTKIDLEKTIAKIKKITLDEPKLDESKVEDVEKENKEKDVKKKKEKKPKKKKKLDFDFGED